MDANRNQQFMPYFSMMCFFLVCISLRQNVEAQDFIPAKYDGFAYEQRKAQPDTVIVEAFFDPICPDCKDAWPPLKEILHHYSSRVSLIVHPFALPYHDSSFVACRALHIANKLNASTTYPLLELFFKHQEKFYNQQTLLMSRDSIVQQIVKIAAETIGISSISAFESGFMDWETDMAARVSFKYGCSRGVMGTPSFFVNGFPLRTSDLDYNRWRSIIDPLFGENSPYSSM